MTVKRDMLGEHREWLLRRNCSLTPRQMGVAYGLMCLLSLSVATAFLLAGMWQVLLFTVLEMSAVAAAFLYFARHATDYEHIVLGNGWLLVERMSAGTLQETRLALYFVRLRVPQCSGELIEIEAQGVTVQIGYFASDPQRRALAYELRAELQGGLFNR